VDDGWEGKGDVRAVFDASVPRWESTWRERWGLKIQLTSDHDDGDHLHSLFFFRFSRKYDVPFVAKNTALFRYFLSVRNF